MQRLAKPSSGDRRAGSIPAPSVESQGTDRAGFDAVFDWAMRQDFNPDHAEQMRREAWDRSDSP